MPAFLFFVANAVILWQSLFDESDPTIYVGVVLLALSVMGAFAVMFQKFHGRK